MSALAFFGILFLLALASAASFAFIAFGGMLLEDMTKLGTDWEKSLIRLLDMLLAAHALLCPVALVLIGIFFFGNREWAASGAKCLFVVPAFSIVFMFLCVQLAAKYR